MKRDEIKAEFTMPFRREPVPGLAVCGAEANVDAMADEIDRLRTRVAWLEHEIGHIDGVIGAATAYTAAMRQDKAVAHQAYQHLADAVKTYWENTLDDDGLEASDVHGS